MWNDTDTPLAYLITFRTKGTWLHGDKRGSVNRFRNKFNSDKLPHEPQWLETNKNRLIGQPVKLNAKQRECIKQSIKETCKIRGWTVLAINIRSNHVHVVISAGLAKPGVVMNAIKANATRTLRDTGLFNSDRSPWADKGSNRFLWNEKSVANACAYVEYEQGEDIPNFD